ncbi:Acyl-CoA dehydrogenase [Paraconexibacter sp. AEG42_29]|uniref:Acyl-CoA dehydrogenase n=1 Tax=Paraconexibacter sp. AEG42_29 TaxID=2997339 RepID=A0AAU7AZS1_9ACTN
MHQTLELTDERRALTDVLRDFARRECGTREQRDTLTDGGLETHNAAVYAKLAELGFVGVGIDERYGGSGGTLTDMCLLAEEAAYGRLPVFGLTTTQIVASTVGKFGSEALKAEILGAVAGGSVESIAMSEPDAGSDVGSLRCRAVAVPGGFVLNGQKTWISNAHIAARILVVARTSTDGSKHEGLTMLSVPVTAAGLEIRGIETMGGREVNDVFLTDVFVADDRVVGRVGEAWPQLMAGLNVERLLIAAMFLGHARRAFEDTLAYVRERRQFGKSIGSFQALKHRVADLATEIECCRMLVAGVLRQAEAEPDRLLPREASMAKLKVTETARRVALEGMQMMGGYGYASEYDMVGHVQTSLASTIYGGTSEIQRELIGRTYGL